MTESYFESGSPAPELLAGDVMALGWNPFKAVASVAKAAVKQVTAPQRAVVNAAVNIAKGQNVAQAVKQAATSLAPSTQSLQLAANAATFVPGIGTGASFAIQFTSSVAPAILAGKNVLATVKANAVSAALGSLPGGTLTSSLVKAVAAVTAKAAAGQNVLKSAANELVGVAIVQIPNAQAQTILSNAATAALRGENVMTAAKQAIINTAIRAIPDAAARAVVTAAVNRKPLATIIQSAGATLLGKAAGSLPTGGAAVLVTSMLGKNPNQIVAAVPAVKALVGKVVQAATAPTVTAYAKAAIKSPIIKVTVPPKPIVKASGVVAPVRTTAAPKVAMSLAIPKSGITSTAAMGLVKGVHAGLKSADASKRKTAQDMITETAKRARAKDADAVRAVAMLKYVDRVA